jgi:hypothetical protein
MLYKRQIKKTNLVSENRNLVFNMKHSVRVEHWCFIFFMIMKRRGGVLILNFSDRWVVCLEDGFLGLLHFEGTSYKHHAHSCILVITSRDP